MIYKYQSLKNHVFFSKKKYLFKHLTLPPWNLLILDVPQKDTWFKHSPFQDYNL